MKLKIGISMLVLVSFFGCQKINNEPPRVEGSQNKVYKFPDPLPLTVEQRNIITNINAEYNEAIK